MPDHIKSIEGLVIYFIVVLSLVIAILGLSYLLGQRRRDKATVEPFESGIVSVGDARLRFSAPFFLVAIFFVIFDLEAVFLFAWVIGFHESGLAGFIEATIFIVILLAGLAYLWKLGALDWRPQSARRHSRTAAGSTEPTVSRDHPDDQDAIPTQGPTHPHQRG